MNRPLDHIDGSTIREEAVYPPFSSRPGNEKPAINRGWRFWAIFTSLALTAFLSALEGSVISTALPAVARANNAGDNFVWIVNVYFLTSVVVQPLYGQLADLWGRRWPMLGAIGLFTVGSAVCGSANNIKVLITGRAVQGLGAAGINTLVEIIICDLVPLRERGQFMGFLFLFIIMGSVIGPFLGGVLVEKNWRWTFYLNLPLGALSMVMIFLLLNADHGNTDDSFQRKLRQIDFLGLLILCGAVTSLLYALTYGGTRFAWSNPGIIASLTMGVVGHASFIGFEASRFCKTPMMPGILFTNRTSATAFVGTFIQTVVSYWVLYFIPLYFQSTLLVSPSKSGLYVLPFSFLYCVSAIIGGGVSTRLGRFKPVHVIGFALMVISVGSFTVWNRDTPASVWVVTQLINALGVGLVTPSLLTAIQADLPSTLNAPSTAAFAFIRSIGTIFGVSIPAAIFNNRFDELLSGVHNEEVMAQLQQGQAYEKASKDFVNSFADPAVRNEIIRMYELSLQRVWQIGIVFAGIGFLAVLAEKDLRTDPASGETNRQLNGDADSKPCQVRQRSTPHSTWTPTEVERRWEFWEQEVTSWRRESNSWGRVRPNSNASSSVDVTGIGRAVYKQSK